MKKASVQDNPVILVHVLVYAWTRCRAMCRMVMHVYQLTLSVKLTTRVNQARHRIYLYSLTTRSISIWAVVTWTKWEMPVFRQDLRKFCPDNFKTLYSSGPQYLSFLTTIRSVNLKKNFFKCCFICMIFRINIFWLYFVCFRWMFLIEPSTQTHLKSLVLSVSASVLVKMNQKWIKFSKFRASITLNSTYLILNFFYKSNYLL